MKNCFIYICCEYPYNIISYLLSKINPFFNQENQENGQTKNYSNISPNIENEEENKKENNDDVLDNNEEEDADLNIEELRKDVLENNDDLDE